MNWNPNPEAPVFTPASQRRADAQRAADVNNVARNLDRLLFDDEANANDRPPVTNVAPPQAPPSRIPAQFGPPVRHQEGAGNDDDDAGNGDGNVDGPPSIVPSVVDSEIESFTPSDPVGSETDFERAVRLETKKRMDAVRDELKAELEAERLAAEEKMDDEIEDKVASLLAKSVAAALKQQSGGLPHPAATPTRPSEGTRTVNGLTFRITPRSEVEMSAGKTKITKERRYELDDATKEKLREKACAPFKTKFEHMKYGLLIAGASGSGSGSSDGSSSDLGKMLLSQQTRATSWCEWTENFDTQGIFFMPQTDDFSDLATIVNAPRLDLRKNFKDAKPQRVFRWQEFVNRQLSLADVESSEWCKDKLEASTDANLLVQLNQSLGRLPSEQRGGVTLWYALAISIDANDTENKRLVTEYIQNHRLSSTPSEDVALSASCFVAAVRTLKLQDVPSDTVELFLKSMADCQCDDFKSVVSAMLGNFHAFGVNTSDAAAQLDQLDVFVVRLTARYRALLAGKNWPAAVSTSGGYNAQISPRPQGNSDRNALIQPNPRWQEWFDRSFCPDCNKYGHPQKYCKDQGARNRPYRPNSKRPPSNNRSNPQPWNRRTANQNPPVNGNGPRQNRTPHFKTSKKDFNKAVHKLWMEHVEERDHDLVAHLADVDSEEAEPEPEMYANIADDEGDYGNDNGNRNDEDEDEGGVYEALAAAGLQSLNW